MRMKSEQRRLAILEAAKGAFLERGYVSTSMAEVSARVGGSKQTLYSYFSSKEDLFIAMMMEKGVAIIDPLFNAFHEETDLKAAIEAFAVAFVRFVAGDEVLAFRRIIYAEGAKSTLGKIFYENGPKRGWTKMALDFQRAMDAGRMRKSDPWVAAAQFSALCESGPIQRLLEGSVAGFTDDDLVAAGKAAADTFIRAYDI